MKDLAVRAKELIKELAHRLPFVPYQKGSRRYNYWNHHQERRFIKSIHHLWELNAEDLRLIKASIVMPAYNRANLIRNALQSVFRQSHQNWELIIVDDGSTDGLKQMIHNDLEDKRICFLQQDNMGVAHARNTGIERSSGKYVFYLDTDNSWRPDYLISMISFMEAGQLDASYSGVRIIGDNTSQTTYFGEHFNWKNCYESNFIDLNAFGHRRALIEDGLRFDEKLNRLVDWDFILGATANHRVAYAPFSGVDYYDGEKGNRITLNVYPGEELHRWVNYIREKHKNQLGNSVPRLRWEHLLQPALKKRSPA